MKEKNNKNFHEDIENKGEWEGEEFFLKGVNNKIKIAKFESKPLEFDEKDKTNLGELLKLKKELNLGGDPNAFTSDDLKIILGTTYEKIVGLLRFYCDLKEEYYSLVAIWIIGTYLHDNFNSYPYLFINAMRGSGKTRLLNLISCMAYNGKLIGSPTEAVLFRLPKGSTVCIDEFEGIMRKGNESLRELLNASYKKGMTIIRMKQKKGVDGTEHVAEEFEPYKPICLANIWGMEEVLGDRCITLILEKSTNYTITTLLENFQNSDGVKSIKRVLGCIKCSLCSFKKKGIEIDKLTDKWNNYVKNNYTYFKTTLTTYTTQTTQGNYILDEDFGEFLTIFNKINDTKINGRNLELFFPLFIIADMLNDEIFDNLLEIAKDLTKLRREEEMTESRDYSLIDFVSRQHLNRDFMLINQITEMFRSFLGDKDNDEKWINSKWVGRALKRLNLILDRRRVGNGIEVTLDVNKAMSKVGNKND